MVCKATVDGLTKDTEYQYQVSYDDGKTWSEINSYKTAKENTKTSLDVVQKARYDSRMTNADGGVMEIVDYNTKTGWAYAVNGVTRNLTAIAIKDMKYSEKTDLLDGNDIDVKTMVEENCAGFVYGDMTSVAVSEDGSKLVVAIQAENYADIGRVALFTCNADGTLQEANAIAVIDLNQQSLTGVYSAGYEDYSTCAVDIDKKDEAYKPAVYETLRGIRMPEGIATYHINGVDYIVTAAGYEPEHFNCSNDNNDIDDRSGKRGVKRKM